MLVLYTENAPLAPRPIKKLKCVCQCTTAVPHSFEDNSFSRLIKSNLQPCAFILKKRNPGENHITFIKISSILWKDQINQHALHVIRPRLEDGSWSVSWDVGHFVQRHGMRATLFTGLRKSDENRSAEYLATGVSCVEKCKSSPSGQWGH